MSSPSSSHVHSQRIELVAALVLATLTVISFFVQAQAATDSQSPLEATLFDLVQFILTVGFTWFGTRAISRADLEASLKRFATSAYRRISDIDEMVGRLRRRIDDMRLERGPEDCHDLDVIAAVVENTAQVVRSSSADWADVIGDELLALEKIRALEIQRSKVEGGADGKEAEPDEAFAARMREIDEKIELLSKELPPKLQLDVQRDESDQERMGHAARWLAERHRAEGGLRLGVVTGEQYTCDRDPESISDGEPIVLRVSTSGVDVFAIDGKALGRVLNDSPLSYGDFREMLQSCYGKELIAAHFCGVYARRTDQDGTYKWYSLVVTEEPTTPAVRRRQGKKGPTVHPPRPAA